MGKHVKLIKSMKYLTGGHAFENSERGIKELKYAIKELSDLTITNSGNTELVQTFNKAIDLLEKKLKEFDEIK